MTQTDYQPADKAALIAVITKERNHLESLIRGLPDSQMVEPGVVGNWSIKDTLAHIAAWERLAFDRLHAATTGEPLKFSLISGDDFVDKFNEEIYLANHDKPLEEVKDEFDAAHSELMEFVMTMDPGHFVQKLPFDWAGNLTFQVVISSNTHWHYIEHADSIEAWLLTTDE